MRCDHGYWSSQLVAPYDEEVAWAIRYHHCYFADESVGYQYPRRTGSTGADYQPPEYTATMTSRVRTAGMSRA